MLSLLFLIVFLKCLSVKSTPISANGRQFPQIPEFPQFIMFPIEINVPDTIYSFYNTFLMAWNFVSNFTAGQESPMEMNVNMNNIKINNYL